MRLVVAGAVAVALDARIHEQMIEQWARFSAWSVVVAGPMVEEIGFRLVLLVLGWVFWRRGLPYSIACHGTANAIHLLAWPTIF